MIYTVCDGLGAEGAACRITASLVDPPAPTARLVAGPGTFRSGVRLTLAGAHGAPSFPSLAPEFESALANARHSCLARTAGPHGWAADVVLPALGTRIGVVSGLVAALTGGACLALALGPSLWPGPSVPGPLTWGRSAFAALAALLCGALLWPAAAVARQWLDPAPASTRLNVSLRRRLRDLRAPSRLPAAMQFDFVIHAHGATASRLAAMTLSGESIGLSAYLAGVAAVVDSGRRSRSTPWQQRLSRDIGEARRSWVASASMDANGSLSSVDAIPDKLQLIWALHRATKGAGGGHPPSPDAAARVGPATRAVWAFDDAYKVRQSWVRLTGDSMQRCWSRVGGCQVWRADDGRLEFVFAENVDALADWLHPRHRSSLRARLAALVATPILFLQAPQPADPSSRIDCVTVSQMVSGQALQPTAFADVIHLPLATGEVASCHLSITAIGFPGPAALSILGDRDGSFALPPDGAQSAITPARAHDRAVFAGAVVAFVILPPGRGAGAWLTVALRNRAGRARHTAVFVHPADVPVPAPAAANRGDAPRGGTP